MLTRPSWTWRPSAPLGGRAFGGRQQSFASADALYRAAESACASAGIVYAIDGV